MKLFIREVAEQDVLHQVGWYAERKLYDIALRFSAASLESIAALIQTPDADAPKLVTNPQIADLRTWPLPDFDDFRVYYLCHPDLLIVIRILHGKRYIGRILKRQKLEEYDQDL